VNCFKSQIGPTGIVMVADASTSAPAAYLADEWVRVPPVDAPDYLDQLMNLCEHNAINLLVPTIDTELALLAESKKAFKRIGTTVLISDPDTIQITLDKRLTSEWLSAHQFPCPRQWNIRSGSSWPRDLPSPVFLKPTFGSRSVGAKLHHSPEHFNHRPPETDLVAQEFIDGIEFTVSTYINRFGRCLAAVPRQRLEVRDGEVSKAVTRKDPEIQGLASSVVEALPGAWGPLNVQIIRSISTGQLFVIEINARFGGGDPLAWQAGANSPAWAIAETNGYEPATSSDWRADLAMLRYDDAIYLPWPS
jgi:carbamoyl-phosphate synthase large subunit